MGVQIRGIAASDGIAIGKAKKFQKQAGIIPKRTLGPEEAEGEWRRFLDAAASCKTQMERLIERCGPGERADILGAHLEMLQDPFFLELIENHIRQQKNAEWALQLATESIDELFSQSDDEMFRARAADLKDVSARLLRELQGIAETDLSDLKEPVIVIAKDLMPSDTATIDTGYVLGFATELGGKTSHVAIMARGLDIPALVGAGGGLYDAVKDGDQLILDGSAGVVLLSPSEQEQGEYREKLRSIERARNEAMALKDLPAVTLDGKPITIAANIGSEKEIEIAVQNGAEGVGLLRTEFLYMGGDHWPTEEEQFTAYRYVVRHAEDKPVIIRTLDIGGDKKLPYFAFDHEDNPFLGQRAIRFCLNRPDIFKTQLRAILRASAFGKALIMLPMVISPEEIERARELIDAAKAELEREGSAFDREIPVGIMIETPAAVLIADALAKKADFFSIGTNDLTQYLLAVDRGNEKIQHLYDPFHPAVLRAIRQVIEAAHAAGIWAGMCGEFASDPMAARLLLGMGLDEFSVSPASAPRLKKQIRGFDQKQAEAYANIVLSAGSAEEIRRRIQETADL
ncbi:MAG: phosphoenolpyruvate--protein phosphotransferase [Clostridiales bacterium]|nr:phosphoenolpyruvate--protein phosphotransferase [Clostridiales bacterium]